MRRFVGIFISILVVCALACSCVRRPKTIPQKKMKEIYKEMFLADQWLNNNPDKRSKADTTWFYKPILEKHGYTLDDYYHTVAVYLEDPKRFVDIMDEVSTMLSSESERLMAEVDRGDVASGKHAASAKWKIGYRNDDLKVITKGYRMTKEADSVWYPKPIVEDTVFSGPEMFFDELPDPVPDSLKADAEASGLPKVEEFNDEDKVIKNISVINAMPVLKAKTK